MLLPVLATLAGAVSGASPCCLPLSPGYLSYVSALPVAGTERNQVQQLVAGLERSSTSTTTTGG